MRDRIRKNPAFAFYRQKEMKKYRVYLIQNEIGRRYIGLSEDVGIRLVAHNEGRSKWTAKYGPWELVWQSGEMSLGEARKLENLMKRQKGGMGLDKILKEQGEFVDRGGS